MLIAKSRLAGLDILRFIAASTVMIFHLGFYSWAPAAGPTKQAFGGVASFPELVPATWWGWVGVQIFFVISGFVIAYSASSSSAYGFARSRFLRLVPGAWICATMTFAVALLLPMGSPSALFNSYFKTVGFWPWGGWIDGVYWTLSIELVFYAVVLGLISVDRLAWLEKVMAFVGTLSTLAWTLHFALGSEATSLAFFGVHGRWFELLLVHHGMYFAVGVFLWLGMMRGWTAFRSAVLLVCLGGGVLPIAALANANAAEYSLVSAQWVPVLVWLIGVGLLWGAVRFDQPLSNRLGPALEAVRVAGLSTYPLYLLHNVLGAALMRVLVTAGCDRFVALGLSIISMILLALAVTLTVEPALRGWISSITQRSTLDRIRALGSPKMN